MKIIGHIAFIAGVVIIIGIRVAGIHMTEGEILIEYFPYWAISFVLLLVGATGIGHK